MEKSRKCRDGGDERASGPPDKAADRYPKHVWSPAGGWYAQPANWRVNTLLAGAAVVGIVAVTWKFSAERETWARKPEPWEWHPSR